MKKKKEYIRIYEGARAVWLTEFKPIEVTEGQKKVNIPWTPIVLGVECLRGLKFCETAQENASGSSLPLKQNLSLCN